MYKPLIKAKLRWAKPWNMLLGAVSLCTWTLLMGYSNSKWKLKKTYFRFGILIDAQPMRSPQVHSTMNTNKTETQLTNTQQRKRIETQFTFKTELTSCFEFESNHVKGTENLSQSQPLQTLQVRAWFLKLRLPNRPLFVSKNGQLTQSSVPQLIFPSLKDVSKVSPQER